MGIIIHIGRGGRGCFVVVGHCTGILFGLLESRPRIFYIEHTNDCGILQGPSGIVTAVSLDSTLSCRVYQFGFIDFYHTDFSIFTLSAAKCRTVFVIAT